MVSQLGYEFAGTVEIALDRLATLPNPDLALLDLNLNGASSEPIADQLVSSGVPLIFFRAMARAASANAIPVQK